MMRVPVGWASNNLPRTVCFVFFGGIFSFVGLPVARAQAPSATPQTPQAPPADTSQNAPKPDAKASNDEIVSHDSPATFKVRVNLVLVRVVVRDNNGKVSSESEKGRFSARRRPQTTDHFEFFRRDSCFPRAYGEDGVSRGNLRRNTGESGRFAAKVCHVILRRSSSLASRRHVFAAGHREALRGHGGSRPLLPFSPPPVKWNRILRRTEGNSRRRSSESCRIHSRRSLCGLSADDLVRSVYDRRRKRPLRDAGGDPGLYELQRDFAQDPGAAQTAGHIVAAAAETSIEYRGSGGTAYVSNSGGFNSKDERAARTARHRDDVAGIFRASDRCISRKGRSSTGPRKKMS